MSASRVIVLGGGTGGTIVANKLRRRLNRDEAEIHVVDLDDEHVFQPGLLFVPFGLADARELVRPRWLQLRDGVTFHQSAVDEVRIDESLVVLADGARLSFDVLVIATGARLQPEETEGLTDAGWGQRVFTFYERESATALAEALRRLQRGRLVVNLVDMPIKCPVAPLEFAFLADAWLHERGMRRHVDIVYTTPLDAAFTKPVAARRLAGLLAEKDIDLVTEFNTASVDGAGGTLSAYDGRTLDFDLLVTVPLHGGAAYVERSAGLGDALGFVPTEAATLQSRVAPNVFVLGDATDLPVSKAGSVAHFEADIVAENVVQMLAGEEPAHRYDGHTSCFVETGGHKALLIDFNLEVEPLPGRFPTALGPLPLLRASRMNHVAKLLSQWIYWNVLLPGHRMPGLAPTMPTAGKHLHKEA